MKKKKKTFPIICLIFYIISIIVLVVEAAIPGEKSAQQSNAIGNTLADFFNDVEGDQTVAVLPESLTITNKIDKGFVGEEHALIYETLPIDSTYKSNVFTSSDKNIASIIVTLKYIAHAITTNAITNCTFTFLCVFTAYQIPPKAFFHASIKFLFFSLSSPILILFLPSSFFISLSSLF